MIAVSGRFGRFFFLFFFFFHTYIGYQDCISVHNLQIFPWVGVLWLLLVFFYSVIGVQVSNAVEC